MALKRRIERGQHTELSRVASIRVVIGMLLSLTKCALCLHDRVMSCALLAAYASLMPVSAICHVSF